MARHGSLPKVGRLVTPLWKRQGETGALSNAVTEIGRRLREVFRGETPKEEYVFDRRPGALRPERGMLPRPLLWLELHDGTPLVRLTLGWGGGLLTPDRARALAADLERHAELADNPGGALE